MHTYAKVALLFYYISHAACAPAETALSDHQHQRLSGRSPAKYDFGLGKRRYILRTSDLSSKRIPHYDFGLGRKRSVVNPYSFGLGKRADAWDYDDLYNESTMDNYMNKPASFVDSQNGLEIPVDFDLEAIKAAYEPKRSRPYSFGLGKRGRNYDFGLGNKRSNEEYKKRLSNRYNFGLGRR